MKKVVLGFSGGLDTSYCVKYLAEEKGYEVHSIIVNTGGFSTEELKKIGENNINYAKHNFGIERFNKDYVNLFSTAKKEI